MDQQRERVETSLTPGHPCRQCPEGSYEKGTVTEPLERDDTVAVVKDVPALVCDVCRDALLAAGEVERLQGIFEQAGAQGVELQSRRYQPPQEAAEEKTVSSQRVEIVRFPKSIPDPTTASVVGSASASNPSPDSTQSHGPGRNAPK